VREDKGETGCQGRVVLLRAGWIIETKGVAYDHIENR